MANKKAPVKAATKAAAAPRKRLRITTSEILYSVLGYLTAREAPLILSRHHGAAPVAELLAGILAANGLPRPRDKYPKLNFPAALDQITNVPPAPDAVVNTAPRDPISIILTEIRQQPITEQNQILGKVIEELRISRHKRINSIMEDGKVLEQKKRSAEIEYEGFLAAVNSNKI